MTLDGAILRVDPATRERVAGEPDVLERRCERSPDHRSRSAEPVPIRHAARYERGLGRRRWLGNWEEINRITAPTDGVVDNFGWPCYEGNARQSGYDGANLNICEGMYIDAGAETRPYFAYRQ